MVEKMTDHEMFKRQATYLSPNLLRRTKISIIGLGSVGSNLADIAMKSGFTNMILCDIDSIEQHNLPNQRFNRLDVGKLKTVATKEFLIRNAYQPMILRTTDDFTSIKDIGKIVFACVDTIKARRELFEHIKDMNWELFIDTRVGWFEISLLFITNDKKAKKRYLASMDDDVEVSGLECGMETIINGALGAANYSVQKALQHLRNMEPLPYEIFLKMDADSLIRMGGKNV